MSSFLTQDQVADKVFLVVVPARLLSAELCRRREGLTTQQVQSCCQSLSPPSVLRGPGSCGQAGPHASQVHVVDPFLRALHPSALSGAALAYTGGRLPTSTPPPHRCTRAGAEGLCPEDGGSTHGSGSPAYGPQWPRLPLGGFILFVFKNNESVSTRESLTNLAVVP